MQLVGSKQLCVENRVQLVGSKQLFVGNRAQLVGCKQLFVENRVQLVALRSTARSCLQTTNYVVIRTPTFQRLGLVCWQHREQAGQNRPSYLNLNMTQISFLY